MPSPRQRVPDYRSEPEVHYGLSALIVGVVALAVRWLGRR